MAHFIDTYSHTIVVGGGMAGLAAATYLARGGTSVTVLEKASDLGGRATTDTLHGFALNRGIHALYTGGPASEVLGELGVSYARGIPRGVFALSAGRLHTFPATALDLLRTDLLNAADKRELMGILFRVSALRTATLARVSAADWIAANATRPAAGRLLSSLAGVNVYSSALDVVSADAFLARLQLTLRHPVHYVAGGWQTLVQGLRQAALQAGVMIRTSASVANLLLREDRVRGIRLHDGAELACDELLLAVTPDDAARLTAGTSVSPLKPTHLPAQVACLDLALSRLPSAAHPVVFDLEQPRFMTVQSQFARLAPDGAAVIHAVKQLDPRLPDSSHADRADLDDFMDQVQPGWRDVVVEQRFLPRMLASGSLPLASEGGLAGRPGYRSQQLPNLYFAGDWVGPRGYLIDASLDSARESARLMLRDRAAETRSLRAA